MHVPILFQKFDRSTLDRPREPGATPSDWLTYPACRTARRIGVRHKINRVVGVQNRRLGSVLAFFTAISSLPAVAPYAAAASAAYTVTDLGTLGGSSSSANALNDAGQVVGISLTTGDVVNHAFMYDGAMHDLGTLGGANSNAFAINEAGQIAGWAETPSGSAAHAFLYDGAMHDLGTLRGPSTVGRAMNASGQVVGYSHTLITGAVYHAFLYDGTLHDLGTLGGSTSFAYGINDSGQVVGAANRPVDDASRPFLYDGTMHDLGTLGGKYGQANAINEAGQVVGYSSLSGNTITHAFLYDGTMHDLGTLGGSFSQGHAINDVADVVGRSSTVDGTNHAFLYRGGAMIDLNSLIDSTSVWELTTATGINNRGQIIGNGIINGQTHAFLLTPVPEPTTLALAAVGGVGFLFTLRKQWRAFAGLLLVAVVTCCGPEARAVTIDTVPVGNPGNPADQQVMFDGTSGYGAVAYDYRIGATEVTNAQYAEFLNAKASSDPLGLYNMNMDGNAAGGITRSGSGTIVDPYVYVTKINMVDKPVNFVSWYDAIRFANWLNNGQGSGDTETGAYTLGQLDEFAVPIHGASITRNAGATWVLASEDEWYKAAYYQPAARGGDTDNYWRYPTASNTTPTVAAASSNGDISNPGVNVVNYGAAQYWYAAGNVTTVGSAGPLSESYYGTSDQGGNVREWTEGLIGGEFRSSRGGTFYDYDTRYLQSSGRLDFGFLGPAGEGSLYGFRVATVAAVPEPSTLVLAVVGMAGTILMLRKRRQGALSRFAGRASRGPLLTILAFALGRSVSTSQRAAAEIAWPRGVFGDPMINELRAVSMWPRLISRGGAVAISSGTAFESPPTPVDRSTSLLVRRPRSSILVSCSRCFFDNRGRGPG